MVAVTVQCCREESKEARHKAPQDHWCHLGNLSVMSLVVKDWRVMENEKTESTKIPPGRNEEARSVPLGVTGSETAYFEFILF